MGSEICLNDIASDRNELYTKLHVLPSVMGIQMNLGGLFFSFFRQRKESDRVSERVQSLRKFL